MKDDIELLSDGDVVYLAMKGIIIKTTNSLIGENFNYSAILDDYQIVSELG